MNLVVALACFYCTVTRECRCFCFVRVGPWRRFRRAAGSGLGVSWHDSAGAEMVVRQALADAITTFSYPARRWRKIPRSSTPKPQSTRPKPGVRLFTKWLDKMKTFC